MKEQPANPVALCSGFTGSEAWRRGGVATEPMSAASLHRKKQNKMKDAKFYQSLTYHQSLCFSPLFKCFHHHSLPFFSYLTFTGQLRNGSKESTLPCLNVLEGLLEKVFHSPLMKNVCGNL